MYTNKGMIIHACITDCCLLEPFPPPSGLHVETIDHESNQVVFTWNKLTARCSSIQYVITAMNCGVCPNTTTDTSITCISYNVSAQMNGTCMIAVQTKICRHLLGERSEYVTVNYVDNNGK